MFEQCIDQIIKAVSFVILGIQASILALWAHNPITNTTLSAAILGFLSVIGVTLLVTFEHSRTNRPSTLTSVYLLAAIVTDCVQIRTLYIRHYVPRVAGLICAGTAAKFLLLVLESLSKRKYLVQDREYTPKETEGIFGRSVFWWLNSLFLKGRQRILSLQELYP